MSLSNQISLSTNLSPSPDLRAIAVPIKMLELELTQPFPFVKASDDSTGQVYREALSLVRLHTRPLGLIHLSLPEQGLVPGEYARQVWKTLGPVISYHLKVDDLTGVAELDERGLSPEGVPKCLAERKRVLADPPSASVIIPTRDRPEHLKRCLLSLLAMDYGEFEIIVVDSVAKTDRTRLLLETQFGNLPQIKYVRESRSGSSAARNRGLQVATGDIVAFTDDDVQVDTHWLAELAKGFNAAEGVGCVTGLIIPLELETPPQLWFEQYGGFSKGFERRVYDLRENRPDNPIYPYNAGGFGSGNSMAFSRPILDAIGQFDPTLGNGTPALGGVDVEAFLRVVVKGYKLVYEPGAIVHHLHRRDYEGLRTQVYNYGVGLTALLAKTLVSHPSLFLDFLRRIPAGVRFALSQDSPLNANKSSDYPSELTWLDRRGMLYGPLAYVRSWLWWHLSQHASDIG